jgi:hypothetical protein
MVTRYKHRNPLQQVLLWSSAQNLARTCRSTETGASLPGNQWRAYTFYAGQSSSSQRTFLSNLRRCVV